MQDHALQLTESLVSGAQEPVKVDLSYCGITSVYTDRLNADASLASGIVELNLGGNPIMQEVCYLSTVLTILVSVEI